MEKKEIPKPSFLEEILMKLGRLGPIIGMMGFTNSGLYCLSSGRHPRNPIEDRHAHAMIGSVLFGLYSLRVYSNTRDDYIKRVIAEGYSVKK